MLGFSGGSDSEESACNAGDLGLIPASGKSPWRRKWRPIPVFLPGELHEQRNLAVYSPWGHEELDMTEQLTHTPSVPGTVKLRLVFSTCLPYNQHQSREVESHPKCSVNVAT